LPKAVNEGDLNFGLYGFAKSLWQDYLKAFNYFATIILPK